MSNLLKEIENRGTDKEKIVWLKFKNILKNFKYKDGNEEYEIFDIIRRDSFEDMHNNFILQNDLFKNNLILYYDNNKLRYCNDKIIIKNKPKAYCEQEFALYKFGKKKI